MEELETKKYAGIDLGRTSVQFSIYREGQEEMTEESFLLSEEEQKEYIDTAVSMIEKAQKIFGRMRGFVCMIQTMKLLIRKQI